ncbi:MAG: sodium/solute symporter [Bacteroidota bacterium]
MLDLAIVLLYFAAIFITAISGRVKEEATVEEYFLSSRNLRWPSIALSSIATNINGYQFLGMMGSAYLYGLAQASLEINAVQGILMAAFIFVPLFLKARVITITQYIQQRLGKTVGLFYSIANLLIFSTITLGAALFWGAYAADLVFEDYFSMVLGENRIRRISIIVVGLGVFSAIYTYFGGLNAVVKTDIIQFSILLFGGFVVLFISIHHLGGWGELYRKTPQLMKLHLPADHPTLPWIHIFGLFLLNINYWCANQTIMQRSLAAKSLRHAQIGLMAGGVMKYVMAVLIVVPGIALYGILSESGGLAEPDMAFPYLVREYLPIGLKGVILCALFASLMSTVDSTFNSLATLWSIDIYQGYINKTATDQQIVKAGKNTILVTLVSGITMGLVLLYIKFENPEAAFTHTLNELRYYINCGIVVLICTAAFMATPSRKATLIGFLSTIPLHLVIIALFPDMNYFVRAMWVIVIALSFVMLTSAKGGLRTWKELIQYDSPEILRVGGVLLLSLVLLHVVFH